MNLKNPPCSPCKNKHSGRKHATFRAGESLQLYADSGATADGQNINKVTATLTRGTEYVSNAPITLSVVSGSAVFTNGETTYEGITDALGTVTTALTDTKAETVDILANYAPASETVMAQSTFVAADLNLFAPVIEGVSNSELWVADLDDTVLIDIFHWGSIADGDVVVLTLSGEDASGLSVEDVTKQHTVGPADLTQQKLVMAIGKDRIRPFGANGHPGETGSLTLRYTVNGVRSPENVFTVHPDDGSTGTTYTVTADLDLFPPVIEGVSSSQLWIADLNDPVLIDIFHWSSIADGDIVVLTLSGEDASGLSVDDVTEQHTIGSADMAQQKLVMAIGKDRIRPFGANGHPGETGSLTLRYTVNGVRSPENVFTVHGDDGSTGTTYKVTADVVVNGADADGIASNVVTWSVIDENGLPVTNLNGTAAVDGSAGINNTGNNTLPVTSMPVTLSYQNHQAQTVTASLILDDNAGSGEARLTFAEAIPDLGCRTESVSPSIRSLISLLGARQFVSGQRYRVTITRPDGKDLFAYACEWGLEYDDSIGDCVAITDAFIPVSVEENAHPTFVATFESPVSGELAGYHTTWQFVFDVHNAGTVQICVETA